jgi:hypothetical protein
MKKSWIIVGLAGALALAAQGAVGVGDTGAGSRSEPSEWTMMLSGLGLVSLGLSRKPGPRGQ